MAFPEQLLRDYGPWLQRVPGPANQRRGHCQFCNSSFNATRPTLAAHMRSNKHRNMAQVVEQAEQRVRQQIEAANQEQQQAAAAVPMVAAVAAGPPDNNNNQATPARHESSSSSSAGGSPPTNVSCRICLYNNNELEKDDAYLSTLQCGHILCSRCIPQVLPEDPGVGHCPMCRIQTSRQYCRRLYFN